MIYRIAKKQSATTTTAVHERKSCDEVFHGFYVLREYKRKEIGGIKQSGVKKMNLQHQWESLTSIA